MSLPSDNNQNELFLNDSIKGERGETVVARLTWPNGFWVSSDPKMFLRFSARRHKLSGGSKFSVHLSNKTNILSISKVKPGKLKINLPLPYG